MVTICPATDRWAAAVAPAIENLGLRHATGAANGPRFAGRDAMRNFVSAAVCLPWLMCAAPSVSTRHHGRLRGRFAGGDRRGAPGESILLQPGATYVGHFRLPARAGNDTRPIILPTAGADAVPLGTRIFLRAPRLAKPVADGAPVLATRPGARFWTVQLLEFLPNRDGTDDIIALGDGTSAQGTLDVMPSDLVVDRVYIHGDARQGQKRGIALNSRRTTISNSYIADIKAVGVDSQAIAGSMAEVNT